MQTSDSSTGTDTTAIEMLLAEHRQIKAMLDDLTHASDVTSRLQTLTALKAVLTLHNVVEENLVYPALAQVAGKKHEAEHLYHETAEADQVVFMIDTMLKTGATGEVQAQADALRAAIYEHIEDEEEKAFPHLQRHATPEQTRLLDASARELRSTFRVAGT